MLEAMHPLGLCGALQLDLCECVCLCERVLSSQQPDVCRAIPLHNYLRTSGTYKHSQRAPALSLFLCLLLSLHQCPFSSVYFFHFLAFSLVSHAHISVSQHSVACIHLSLYCFLFALYSSSCAWAHAFHCLHSCQTTLSPAHTYTISLFSFPQLEATSLSLLSALSSSSCVTFTCHSFWLVKTSLSLSALTTAVFAIQILFRKIVTWCVHVLCLLSRNHPAKLLENTWNW